MKLYIENINNLFIEWTLKMIIFNIVMYLNYIVFTIVLAQKLENSLSIVFITFGLQIVFIIYDFVFSMFIQYYNNKLRKYVK